MAESPSRSSRGFWPATPVPRGHLILIVLLIAGAGLRLWFLLAYRPAFVGYPDSRAYIVAAHGPLYWNPYKPVGYPLLLRLVHVLDARLSFAIAVQHLLGLLSAALIYLTTVPFLKRSWMALLPAIVILFGGAEIFIEHSVLSDGPYTFLLVVVLYGAVRSRDGKWGPVWLAGAGLALAASITLRTVGLILVPVLAAWALTGQGRSLRGRAVRLSALVLPAVVGLVVYLIPQHAETGSWGLTRSDSFTFYARMAPIADCTRFKPPPGTARLCQSSRPGSRPDANWYIFNARSPAVRLYGVPPYPLVHVPHAGYLWPGDGPTRRFAQAVLAHQPLDYVATVLEGLANYVAPRTGSRSVFEYDQAILVKQLHNPSFERAAIPAITSYYSTGPGFARHDVAALDAYGQATRTEGPVSAVLVLLMTAGCVLARGPARSAALLFTATALCLALMPVAILFYDVRYAAPVVVPLAAAAAIGSDRMWDLIGSRMRARTRRSWAPS